MSDTVEKPQVPQDFDALRTAILERKGELPKRLTQVAAYALDHPDEIAFGTAASIAISAAVQPSTLVRFAQHFGFDGLPGCVSEPRLTKNGCAHWSRMAQHWPKAPPFSMASWRRRIVRLMPLQRPSILTPSSGL